MSPFEKHEIKHLSWSSLKLFRNEPALWVLKYLHGYRDHAGPAAWRGKAVEAGLDWFLYKGKEGALEAALKQFDLDYHDFLEASEGEIPNKLDDESANIEPMLLQAMDAAKDWGTPLARQIRIEHNVPGVEVPLIGYVDYVFDDWLVDLKTTLRCPSDAKPEDVRQVLLYQLGTGKLPRLLYVTPKKSAFYPVEGDSAAVKDIERLAHSVRTLLSMCNAKEATRLFAPNFDNFYWDFDSRKEWERVAA